MNPQTALNEYRSISVESGVADASPHRLVSMLLAGALDKIAMAKNAVGRGDVAEKGLQISKVISIIDSLRASLDESNGGDIAGNLGSIYDYAEQRLLEANLESDTLIMDEVSQLLRELHDGWVQIADQVEAV